MSAGEVEYHWIVVGKGDPEPAAIVGEKPNRKAYTFQCADPFDVDSGDSGVEILLTTLGREAPINPGYSYGVCTQKERDDRERAYQEMIKKPGYRHSYSGFGRRPAIDDASLAEDAKQLSPEGVAARAEGIAQ